ncbi:hypothetical protein CUPA0130 [Campylobacter upsaliensis RM3195]|nr:hypothetical protein CUPA0130 [Campylobacter upsaliensis RM3195]
MWKSETKERKDNNTMKNKDKLYNKIELYYELYYQILDEAKKYFTPQKLCKESIQDFFKAMQKQHKALRTYGLFKHKNKEGNFFII